MKSLRGIIKGPYKHMISTLPLMGVIFYYEDFHFTAISPRGDYQDEVVFRIHLN